MKNHSKNKLVIITIVSFGVMLLNGVYRLSIGCRGMFSDCYIEGVDKFMYLYYSASLIFYLCCALFFYKLIVISICAIIKKTL